jgi:hypothetical protein
VKKKTIAPKKKVSAKQAKKKLPAVKSPTLVITVHEDCSLTNNQNLHPPHASKSTGGGFPNHIEFAAYTKVWICLPAGYLKPEPDKPLVLEDGDSADFKVVSKPPSAVLVFKWDCQKACDPITGLNADEIIIDA